MTRKILLICSCAIMFCLQGFSQTQTVTGRVVSALDKQPIPGVTVMVKGTTNGVMTTIQGAFSINVPAGQSTLIVRFVGYATKQVEVTAGQTDVQISLTEEVLQLNDVVCYGLQQQKTKRADQRRFGGIINKIKRRNLKRYWYHAAG